MFIVNRANNKIVQNFKRIFFVVIYFKLEVTYKFVKLLIVLRNHI